MPAPRDPSAGAPGVGLLYNPALPAFLETDLDALDYLAVIPDMFWVAAGGDGVEGFQEIEEATAVIEAVAGRRTVVAHSIGFSLGSAEAFAPAYLRKVAEWQARFGFPWHSDHLSFVSVHGAEGESHNAGLAIPVPYDRELLELIAARIGRIQEAVEAPFLIENNVYFIDIPEQEMSEVEFLNALCERTGCGLLLDLHNVYANSRNHGFDPLEFVDGLELGRVVEIHIAGGSELGGTYMDSHAGPCPEPVWELLEEVVPRCPALAGVTFEFQDSYYPLLGPEGTRAELERARRVLDSRGSG